MVVEREGEPLTLEIVYSPTPRSIINLRLGIAAIGLAFLVFCLWPIVMVRTPQALALAHIGLVAGVATFGMGPYLGTWDGVASHLQLASTALLAALLLRFFLEFPEPKGVAGIKSLKLLLSGTNRIPSISLSAQLSEKPSPFGVPQKLPLIFSPPAIFVAA